VCRSGSRSQVACEQLADAGFENLANLAGGMIDWKRHGLPSK
jgi:rhodanese-related sulfurtransferase